MIFGHSLAVCFALINLVGPGSSQLEYCTLSTSKVDCHLGNAPNVLKIGALLMHYDSFRFFFTAKHFQPPHAVSEIPTCDLACPPPMQNQSGAAIPARVGLVT